MRYTRRERPVKYTWENLFKRLAIATRNSESTGLCLNIYDENIYLHVYVLTKKEEKINRYYERRDEKFSNKIRHGESLFLESIHCMIPTCNERFLYKWKFSKSDFRTHSLNLNCVLRKASQGDYIRQRFPYYDLTGIRQGTFSYHYYYCYYYHQNSY
jgi:hypothetical protein